MVEPVSMSIAIASLVSSAPHWFRAIESSALNQGKDFAIGEGKKRFQNYLDERKHTQNVQLALKNAAERGLKQFTTPEERDLYRDMLRVLVEGNSEALRREAIRQLSLSDEPDYKALSEKYNLSQRITALAEKTTHTEVDATPYLKSFFDALLIELYNDPLFRAQMSDLIQVRAAMSEPRILSDILSIIRQVYSLSDDAYVLSRFPQDVDTYLDYAEKRFHYHNLRGMSLSDSEEKSPELNGIFVPLRIEGFDSKTDAQEKNNVLSLLEQYNYVVLLGGPGAGKSILTRYLMWCHAHIHTVSEVTASQLHTVLAEQPVPLRIELRLFSDARRQHPGLSFLSYMTDIILKQEDIIIPTQMFRELLERRAMFVLFDGLDEVATLRERRLLIEEIENFVQRYPGNRILVTSRPVGYSPDGLTDRMFHHRDVLDFDDAQIRQFIENWYRYVLRYTTLQTDDRQEIDLFYNALMRNGRLHKLAANPLLLTVMTAMHRQKRLPDERVLIYQESVDLLLARWAKLKYEDMRWKDMKLSERDQLACLAYLGHILHERAQNNSTNGSRKQQDAAVDVPANFMHRELKKFLNKQKLLNLMSGTEQNEQVDLFLKMVQTEAGLLVERGIDENGEALYGFIHRTFQEYFAAVHIYNRYEEEEDATIISDFLKKYAYVSHWREVVLLLLAKLPRKPATRRLRELLNDNNYPQYKDVTQQDLFFVALCLEEGIAVENDFAEEVLSHIHRLADSSPFPSQQHEAISVFGRLLKTKLYVNVGQRHLKALINEIRTSSVSKAVELAKVIYRVCPVGCQERREVVYLLIKQYKQGNLDVVEQIEVAGVIYGLSQLGSEEKRQGFCLLVELFKRNKLSIVERIEIARFIQRYSPAGSEERREGDYLLINLYKQEDLSVAERIQVARVIYLNSSKANEEIQEGFHMLIELYKQEDLSVAERIQIARAVYVNSLPGSAEWLTGLRFLTQLYNQGGLNISEQLKIVQTIYTNNSSKRSKEKQEAGRLLLVLYKHGSLSVNERLKIAQTIYQNSLAKSKEKQEIGHLLIKLLKEKGLGVTEQLETIRVIYQYSPVESEERREGKQLLIELFKRKDLSIAEQLEIASIVYNSNSIDVLERRNALELTKKFAQNRDIPIDLRLQAAIMPCTVNSNNFLDRVESIHMVLTIIQGKEAKLYIGKKWVQTSKIKEYNLHLIKKEGLLPLSDINAIYELAKLDVLLEEIRGEMYKLLIHVLSEIETVEYEKNEED